MFQRTEHQLVTVHLTCTIVLSRFLLVDNLFSNLPKLTFDACISLVTLESHLYSTFSLVQIFLVVQCHFQVNLKSTCTMKFPRVQGHLYLYGMISTCTM